MIYSTPDFYIFEVFLRLKPESCSVLPPFMYLGPENDDTITAETVEKNSTLPASDAEAHSLTCLSLAALSLGTGLLYISDGLWCVRGQNQRAPLVLDHHVILNPDAQAAETLRHLVIVLTDVQPCVITGGEKWKMYESLDKMKCKRQCNTDHV